MPFVNLLYLTYLWSWPPGNNTWRRSPRSRKLGQYCLKHLAGTKVRSDRCWIRTLVGAIVSVAVHLLVSMHYTSPPSSLNARAIYAGGLASPVDDGAFVAPLSFLAKIICFPRSRPSSRAGPCSRGPRLVGRVDGRGPASRRAAVARCNSGAGSWPKKKKKKKKIGVANGDASAFLNCINFPP